MSTRTIVEINHDLLRDCEDDLRSDASGPLVQLVKALCFSDLPAQLNSGQRPRIAGGAITVLAQRHHSTELTLTVK